MCICYDCAKKNGFNKQWEKAGRNVKNMLIDYCECCQGHDELVNVSEFSGANHDK